MPKNLYTEDSIQKMDPLSFTRHRPDSYLGSNENSTQLVREIVSNCSDEFLIGNCDTVYIYYNEISNEVRVVDNGQGIIPNAEKENGKTILEMVYGDINTSGKYDKSDDAVYKVSTGAFGIGASLTNFLSHYLIAETKRDGQFERVYFVEGKFSKRESGECPKSEHGVSVRFQPSEEFFRDERPNIPQLKQELFNLACVCRGLKFYYNDEPIYHPDGLKDIIRTKAEDKEVITQNPFCFTVKNDNNQILDFCLTCTTQSDTTFIPFCNYGLIENGAPLSTVKSTITRVLNNWGKRNNILKGKPLSGADIQEGMIVAFNLVSQNIRYDSQTKVRATSTEDNPFISTVLGEQFDYWLDSHAAEGKAILEKAILARKASDAARKAREQVKKGGKKKKKKIQILHPDRLKDAEHLGEDSTLLIVEGLSAGASMCLAREADKYGILMLQGKLINAFMHDEKKLLANNDIQLLFQALNIEPHKEYKAKNLRYGKIAICVDSDRITVLRYFSFYQRGFCSSKS